MTPEQFAYWLQGFAELNPQAPTAAQWQSIREHLGTVFGKVTPPLVDTGRAKAVSEQMREALRSGPFYRDLVDATGGYMVKPGTFIC